MTGHEIYISSKGGGAGAHLRNSPCDYRAQTSDTCGAQTQSFQSHSGTEFFRKMFGGSRKAQLKISISVPL